MKIILPKDLAPENSLRAHLFQGNQLWCVLSCSETCQNYVFNDHYGWILFFSKNHNEDILFRHFYTKICFSVHIELNSVNFAWFSLLRYQSFDVRLLFKNCMIFHHLNSLKTLFIQASLVTLTVLNTSEETFLYDIRRWSVWKSIYVCVL